MTPFAAARKNMVDCQIHPAGVTDERILAAYRAVMRETYIPGDLAHMAYVDECLALGRGQFMIEPAVQARMIQALSINPGDRVLMVAADRGYAAALIRQLTSFVSEDEVKSKSESKPGPFDAILINGTIGRRPDALLEMLSPRGALCAILREDADRPQGRVVLYSRTEKDDGPGAIAARVLFEAGCPYVPGFEPRPVFQFAS